MPSTLHTCRLKYSPRIPKLLQNLLLCQIVLEKSGSVLPEIASEFPQISQVRKGRIEKTSSSSRAHPLRVGVLFSGGPASGGHNVIAAIFDAIQEIHPSSCCIGFLDGPSGLIENRFLELTKELIDSVRNIGGFDLLGSGRTKMETAQQFSKAALCLEQLQLDGLVIIGGDDSNTNAALFAEYLLEKKIQTRVIGVPKTIDGDLRSDELPISFGFDTATKTYSELIGNIARDASSAKKYYHFIRLMGRSASHVALECALQTHPNLALIGEEVFQENQSLQDIVSSIAQLISRRQQSRKLFGVILIPEGLIEFIPEMRDLIDSLNQLVGKTDSLERELAPAQRALWDQLPPSIQKQFLSERDPHGYLQLSKIETETLLLELIQRELDPSIPFRCVSHFLGYEGRSGFPSNFDATYGYALGRLAALAIFKEQTAVLCAFPNIQASPDLWQPKLLPLSQWIHFEMREGKKKPVIRKALVDMQSASYRAFARERASWEINDSYQMPGPIQFFGGSELSDSIPVTLSF